MTPLLEVSNLRISIAGITIVDGMSFGLQAGQVFGLAGESGSGKTMTALSLLGLLPGGAQTSGRAMLDGADLLTLNARAMRAVRGRKVAMVFQDPTSSLHPMLSIEYQLTERLRYHLGRDAPPTPARRALDLL